MFVAHDAGHRIITGDSTIDTLIGALIAGLCCNMRATMLLHVQFTLLH